MILTDEEMQQVRRCIEAQAGLDEELVRRCGHLIHLGAFDEAVRSAFVLVEERLRAAVNEESMTGTQLANFAFNPSNGPLALQLAHNQSEREGLRELYSGAFKLFRNPTAHGVVGYGAAEGKGIIGLVNLLLGLLKRAREMPPPGLFPDNVERVLDGMEDDLGPGAVSRLRAFLGKCMELGLNPSKGAKAWIPFRKHAWTKFDSWEDPRRHAIAAFYVTSDGSTHKLHFPVNNYYAYVVGFDVDQLTDELAELGFRPVGKEQNPTIDLRLRNDQPFFDALFSIVARTTEELEGTFQQH